MRPAAFLLLALGACAPQPAPPAPAPAIPMAARPAAMPGGPTVFGVVPPRHQVEPAHDPFGTGSMEQPPALPRQVSPAFQGL
jgi:hypothetical protein